MSVELRGLEIIESCLGLEEFRMIKKSLES